MNQEINEVEQNSMTSILNDKKSVLIIPVQKMDLDAIWAAEALAHSLVLSGKSVKILVSENNYPAVVSQIAKTNEGFQLRDGVNKDYKISLDKNNVDIQNISWEQNGDKVDIIVNTTNGKLDPQSIKVDALDTNFDLTILIGNVNLESLGEYFEKNPQNFQSENIIHINTTKNSSHQKIFFDKNTSTLSELIFAFISESGLQLDKKVAQNLISGIYWKTNSLKDIRSSGVFEVISKLSKTGVNIRNAAKKGFKSLRVIDVKFIDEIIKNIKITKERIGISKIKADVINKINPSSILFPSWNILNNIIDIDTSIIIIENNEKTHVLISSLFPNPQILKIVKKYDGQATSSKGEFTTEIDPTTIESELRLAFAVSSIDDNTHQKLQDKLNSDIEKSDSVDDIQREELVEQNNDSYNKKEPLELNDENSNDQKMIEKETDEVVNSIEVPVVEEKADDLVVENDKIAENPVSISESISPDPNDLYSSMVPIEPPIAATIPSFSNPMNPVQSSAPNNMGDDPLKPASNMPEPLQLGKKEELKPNNSPLPTAR